MAIGKAGIGMVEESGYLSDESDFYGDKNTKQELENKVNTFDAAEWWKRKIPTLMEIAEKNMKANTATKSVKLYNIYEGSTECARQLSESVEDFLARLRPATTPVSQVGPWIYIANPYREAPKGTGHDEYRFPGEEQPDDDGDWGAFVTIGNSLLQQLVSLRHELEKKKSNAAKATITKALNADKERIVQEILDTAKTLNCTGGKWMLFCDSANVNAVWSVVAKAVANNELGTAAKVAAYEGQDRKPHLICIYTKDFTDMKDVSRVVHKMKDLGLIDSREKPIYYKCDAYTYLELKSANPYNIKASLYSSKDILQAKTEKQLYSFFYKKKKDEGDWRPLKWE